MKNNIWRQSERFEYGNAFLELNEFFGNLEEITNNDSLDEDMGVGYTGLSYRCEQADYAIDIMKAIEDKKILLIQAGVGTGKSLGYLLPIFYTHKNVCKFKKILISTSSIALQQQLLTDINRVSNMLDVNLEVSIAKGVNNYACLKRIEYSLSKGNVSLEEEDLLRQVRDTIKEIDSCAKEDLEEINEKLWKSIQLKGRGYCSNCIYTNANSSTNIDMYVCPFYRNDQRLESDSGIIITNHANLVKNIVDRNKSGQSDKIDLLKDVDMIVFDEAHHLENTIRDIGSEEIFLRDLEYYVKRTKDEIVKYVSEFEKIELEDSCEELIIKLGHLFSSLRTSSKREFTKINKNDNNSIMDFNKLTFKYSDRVVENLEAVVSGYRYFYSFIKDKNGFRSNFKEFLFHMNTFEDMFLKDLSKNIYWIEFFRKDLINLCYTSKSNLEVVKNIGEKDIPIVYTSATLSTTNNNYSYFMNGLQLEEAKGNHSLEIGGNYPSPFNYEENVLFYYDPELPTPVFYDDYKIEIALKIIELIKATKGKTLVLFTSKSCMRDVYNLVKEENFDFEIFLHDENNTEEVKKNFEEDVNSCLFATGAFWEGIDIKGESLSNVIITRLPFDVVDAVNQYKASIYSSLYEQLDKVYIPNMILKLKQAMGRLIRGHDDTGIIACLDSRIVKYMDKINDIPQVKNSTTDMRDVYDFVDYKVLKKVR